MVGPGFGFAMRAKKIGGGGVVWVDQSAELVLHLTHSVRDTHPCREF